MLWALNISPLITFNFDIGVGDKVGVVRKTHMQLTDKTFYLPRGLEHFCLMDIVANKMANKDFYNWIKTLDENELNQMTTEKGICLIQPKPC